MESGLTKVVLTGCYKDIRTNSLIIDLDIDAPALIGSPVFIPFSSVGQRSASQSRLQTFRPSQFNMQGRLKRSVTVEIDHYVDYRKHDGYYQWENYSRFHHCRTLLIVFHQKPAPIKLLKIMLMKFEICVLKINPRNTAMPIRMPTWTNSMPFLLFFIITFLS
jgi:hypothetical protein